MAYFSFLLKKTNTDESFGENFDCDIKFLTLGSLSGLRFMFLEVYSNTCRAPFFKKKVPSNIMPSPN